MQQDSSYKRLKLTPHNAEKVFAKVNPGEVHTYAWSVMNFNEVKEIAARHGAAVSYPNEVVGELGAAVFRVESVAAGAGQ